MTKIEAIEKAAKEYADEVTESHESIKHTMEDFTQGAEFGFKLGFVSGAERAQSLTKVGLHLLNSVEAIDKLLQKNMYAQAKIQSAKAIDQAVQLSREETKANA